MIEQFSNVYSRHDFPSPGLRPTSPRGEVRKSKIFFEKKIPFKHDLIGIEQDYSVLDLSLGRGRVRSCELRVRGNNDVWYMSNNSGNDDERGSERENERGVATKTRPKTKKPSQYRVLLLNDDYTPMEFVVGLLMGVFKKTQEEATKIMLDVHQNGMGVCGIYTFEVAETKVAQVLDAAKRNDHPLKCTLEKA